MYQQNFPIQCWLIPSKKSTFLRIIPGVNTMLVSYSVSMVIHSVLYYNNHIYICSLFLFFIITTTDLLSKDVRFTKISKPKTPPLNLVCFFFFKLCHFPFISKGEILEDCMPRQFTHFIANFLHNSYHPLSPKTSFLPTLQFITDLLRCPI